MAVFHGCVIAVELSTQTPFKKKADLRRKITDNGGTVSFIVNKKCSYLIVNDKGNNDISYKCRTALKLGIPIVDASFIDQCIEAQKILNPDYFLAIGKTKAQEFDSGKIAVSHHHEKVNKSCQTKNLNEFPVWISKQTGCPSFSEKHYEVTKFSVLCKKNKSTDTGFYVLEIHVDRPSDMANFRVPNKFRISSHYGKLPGNKYDDVCGETEYRFAQTSEEALFIYNALYQQMTERPNSYMKTTKLLSWRIGSLKFQQLASECLYIHDDGDLSAVVKELVEHIWKEALGTATQFLNSGVTSIKTETLDKAEATLLEIRRALDKGSDTEMLEKLSDEFYLHIQEKEQQVIKTKKLLASKYNLCQLLRDIHSVLESMDWQLENASEAQYRALICLIHELTKDSMEYRNVHHMVANSKCGSEQVTVKNIYKIHRGVEAGKFCNEFNNTKYLFHATGVENLVGVLSRGLLLPKTVVDSFAGTRSDTGMLGSAIYFTDALSTSLKYSHPSISKGTRMMLVCEVALGNSHNVYKADNSIHSPPEGYHSVHGVRNTSDVPSDFQDDEYGIYDTSQQKLCYVVEFTLPADEIKSLSLSSLPLAEQSCLPAVDNNVDPVDIGDQKADKVQRAGLFSSTNVSVPLKSVHVRARLLDLASQVVVLQSYANNSNSPIEAKYVFPLAENAVVCGFEAFINGKHIVGQVKEKETAHKEYRKAIKEGHGAYLMDQEQDSPLASECLYIHDDGDLSVVVKEFVEHIWKEALGTAAQFLNSGVTSIKTETLDKAEAILLEIRRALDKGSDTEMLKKLSDEFYLHIQEKEQQVIKTKKLLASKYNLCQLLRDIHCILESMDWQLEKPSEAQYRALRCLIHELTRESMEYTNVHHMVANSKCGSEQVAVKNIYQVHRGVEAGKFCNELNNTRYLFHATGVENLVGVLSRGLLLPKTVVDSFAGTRSDNGMLGSAIYFTDALSTSLKYSHPSVSKGTRMMLVCEVALGNSHNVYKADNSIHSPPEGYHSVHGVRNTSDVPSDFQDDEYGIYDTSQQKLCYVVEFTLPADEIKSLSLSSLPLAEQSCLPAVDNNVDPVDIGDQKADKVQRAGLFSSTNVSVPLKSVHVRARLLDLASQVVVLQSYANNSNSPIEAKYVFPLAENAVVCGFEAFINGKHIVGQVKEKETAHKEYRKAIKEGHGAYLMDQEQDSPDVFTVSVGNLPPRASVLIKITYVAEVVVEGELIVFTVPASVAPWIKHAALNEQTQYDVDTIKVDGNMNETTVHVAMEMPFDIRSIRSPTHKIRIKKTATRAVVEMCKNQILAEDGLRLEVTLSQIHVPRMWVERHPDNPDHQACMLTFYPEFEARAVENYEVVFLLDLSNSMKGSAIREAKKILLMCLEQLPKKCTFNVVVFGTAFEELFSSPRCKNKNNMNIAHKFMMKAEAVMGNTEIFRPLQTYFFLHSSDRVRNLFVISDGHINNEDLVLNAAKLNSRHTRIFTLGVSVIANRHTLSNLARMGAGTFEFFDSKTTNKWQEQVECLLWKASQPSLTSVSVEWQQFSDDLAGPQQAPIQITSLFNGSRQVVFGFVPNCLQATLKAVVDGQEIATLVSTAELNITTGLILHRLTAKALIHDWEDGTLAEDHIQHQFLKKTQKSHMVNLSIQYSIVTQFTSFVAIEKREEGEVVNVLSDSHIQEIIEKESVDILNYMGWESSPTDEQAHLQPHRQKDLPPEELIETLLRSAKIQIVGSPTLAEQIYDEAWQIATKNLCPTNPTRLKVAMSMASFFYNTKHDRQKASEIATCAFEDSISELDTLSEDSYKDSTLFLQLLRDNLTLWSEEAKPLSDGLTGDADLYDLLDVSCVYDLMENDEASLEISEAISHPIGLPSDEEEEELLAELEELLKEDVKQNKGPGGSIVYLPQLGLPVSQPSSEHSSNQNPSPMSGHTARDVTTPHTSEAGPWPSQAKPPMHSPHFPPRLAPGILQPQHQSHDSLMRHPTPPPQRRPNIIQGSGDKPHPSVIQEPSRRDGNYPMPDDGTNTQKSRPDPYHGQVMRPALDSSHDPYGDRRQEFYSKQEMRNNREREHELEQKERERRESMMIDANHANDRRQSPASNAQQGSNLSVERHQGTSRPGSSQGTYIHRDQTWIRQKCLQAQIAKIMEIKGDPSAGAGAGFTAALLIDFIFTSEINQQKSPKESKGKTNTQLAQIPGFNVEKKSPGTSASPQIQSSSDPHRAEASPSGNDRSGGTSHLMYGRLQRAMEAEGMLGKKKDDKESNPSSTPTPTNSLAPTSASMDANRSVGSSPSSELTGKSSGSGSGMSASRLLGGTKTITLDQHIDTIITQDYKSSPSNQEGDSSETAEILLKAMPVTEYRQSKMPPVEKFAGSSDETIKLKLSSDVSIPTLGSALHVLDGTSQDSRMPKSYTDETVEDQHIKIPRSVVSGKMKKKKFPFSGNFNQENDDKQTKQVTFGSPAIVSRSKKEKLQTPILFGQRLICDSITKESALIDNLGIDTSGDFSMATPAAQSQMAIPMAPPQIKMSNQMAPPSSFLTRPSAAKSMPFSFGGFGGGGMPQQSQSYLGMEEARMNMMDDSLSEIEGHLVAGAALHAHVGGSRGRGGRAYLSRKSTRYVESTEPCQTAVKSAQPEDIKLYGKGAVRYVRSILRTSVKRSNTEAEAIARLQEEEGYWQFSETLVNLLGIDKAAFMNVLSDAGIHSLGKTATEDIYRLVLTMITVIQILCCRGISQHHLQSEFQKYVEETKQKNPFKDSRLMNGEINMENAILRGVAYTVSMDKMRPLVYSQLELGKNWFHVAYQMLDVNL